MRTLLALSTLPREGPSVRPRVLAYEPALAARDIRLLHRPFLSSRAFAGFYKTSRWARAGKACAGARGYLRRALAAAAGTRADAVLVHRELVPRGSAPLLRALARRARGVLYDLDDAIYLSPRDFVSEDELSHRRMSRLKDSAQAEAQMARADVVLAGNETLAARARLHCDDVRVQPTPVDTERYRPRLRERRDRPLVGWVGSPTAAYCLKAILPALARAAREAPFDLLVVGAGERIEVEGVRVECRDWSLETESAIFSSLDVGLYPLPDNPWTRGKCGMKALQYLASGAAAVVSPVGVNREIVTDGETGSFAESDEDWTDRLVRYLTDEKLRAAHAEAGREAVAARWSLAALTPGFVAAVEDVLG